MIFAAAILRRCSLGILGLVDAAMIWLSSADCEGSDRIRRNTSVKYYGKIVSVSR